jgi:hypothetical protein
MTSENIGMRIRQEGRAAKWSSIVKTRSCLVLLVWISVITVQVTAQDTGQPPPVEVSLITGHLHQLRCNDNVGVIASIGDDGTLLVDTGYAGTATAVSDELAKLGSSEAVRFGSSSTPTAMGITSAATLLWVTRQSSSRTPECAARWAGTSPFPSSTRLACRR